MYSLNEFFNEKDNNIFHEQLYQIIDTTENNFIKIVSDMNKKVGNNNQGMKRWLGKEGENTKNDSEPRLTVLNR